MAELDRTAGYANDRNILQQRLSALPGQADAEIKGLDAKLGAANDNILQGARARGIGFSGIPIAEQAQYAATDYAPAVARVKTAQNEQSTGILGTLNSLSRDQRTQAQNIFEAQRQFDEQKRQFDLQMAEQRAQRAAAERAARMQASAGDFLGGLGLGDGGGAAAGKPGTQAQMSQRKGGGFNFTIGGKSVSAAAYAAATKTPIRTLLATMAKAGDSGAKAALGFVGGDMRYDPRKMNAQNAAVYNSLFWGLMPGAKAPAAAKKPAPTPIGRLQNAYTPGGWS